jgi:hypothetical protein
MRGGVEVFKVSDVVPTFTYKNQPLSEVLDRLYPIKRKRQDPSRQLARVLLTSEERDEFHRQMDRLQRHVSNLIADKAEDFTTRELKLFYQLVELARRVKTFQLIVTAKKLMTLTGLDDEDLPKARRALERRFIIRTKQCSVDTAWEFMLLDPATREQLPESIQELSIKPLSSWNDPSDWIVSRDLREGWA